MTKIAEIFGVATRSAGHVDWGELLKEPSCPYRAAPCLMVRQDEPDTPVGTCSVHDGETSDRILICKYRLLDHGVFADCFHLLALHEPDNELHIVPEVSVPWGSVDYFLTSVKNGRVRDFVGVELQAFDTTGTVWPERQRFLQSAGIEGDVEDVNSRESFGMDWKKTAEDFLSQLHNKTESFEFLGKHIVVFIQDTLLDYIRSQHQFDRLGGARLGDPLHIHSYSHVDRGGKAGVLELNERLSTDVDGIPGTRGPQENLSIGLEDIVRQLESRLSSGTLLKSG